MTTRQKRPDLVRNLSACYQEALTATARLMSRSHELPDAATFRSRILTLLKYAESQAVEAGFDAGDIGPASFAVVALVDEAAMNSGLPAFQDWDRKTLREELYQRPVGGEAFFSSLDEIMRRPETAATADLLDLHLTCMVLGFKSQYAGVEALAPVRRQIWTKIARIRGASVEMSPRWRPPGRRLTAPGAIPRTRRALRWLAIACAAGGAIYMTFFTLLRLGAGAIAEMAR